MSDPAVGLVQEEPGDEFLRHEESRLRREAGDQHWPRRRLLTAFMQHELRDVGVRELLGTLKVRGRASLKTVEERIDAAVVEVGRSDASRDLFQHQFVTQAKPWLAIRLLERGLGPTELPRFSPFDDFLGSFATDECGWYGPTSWEGDPRHYYVGVVDRPWNDEKGDPLYIGRWHVVAVVRRRDVTFHWHNPPSPKTMQEARHFIFVRDAIKRFLRAFPAADDLNLHKLFLDDLWQEYRLHPLELAVETGKPVARVVEFEDTYIHARDRGIALTACISKADAMKLLGEGTMVGSGTEQAVDLRRIRDLTDKLTVAALGDHIADLSEAEVRLANQRVLTEFIKGWSPRSYECMLVQPGGEPRNLFMAKAFFGNDLRHGNFVHLKCHPEFGRSYATAEFLLRKLGEW